MLQGLDKLLPISGGEFSNVPVSEMPNQAPTVIVQHEPGRSDVVAVPLPSSDQLPASFDEAGGVRSEAEFPLSWGIPSLQLSGKLIGNFSGFYTVRLFGRADFVLARSRIENPSLVEWAGMDLIIAKPLRILIIWPFRAFLDRFTIMVRILPI